MSLLAYHIAGLRTPSRGAYACLAADSLLTVAGQGLLACTGEPRQQRRIGSRRREDARTASRKNARLVSICLTYRVWVVKALATAHRNPSSFSQSRPNRMRLLATIGT